MSRAGRTAAACVLSLFAMQVQAAPRRVLSVDQCADQYVLALADRSTIVGVSPLATEQDSWMRRQAKGLPRRRADLEEALAARPDLVVRSWTPNARLVPALKARDVSVYQLGDANDFNDVRRNIKGLAEALGRPAAGERLIAEMDADLARAKDAWGGRRALYLTQGGYTAGQGTMVDAMLSAAGLTNAAAAPGYAAVPLEKLTLNPPDALVLAFYDPAHIGRWDVARRPLVQRLAKGRTIAALPGSMLLCPAWFSAKASLLIASRAPRRP